MLEDPACETRKTLLIMAAEVAASDGEFVLKVSQSNFPLCNSKGGSFTSSRQRQGHQIAIMCTSYSYGLLHRTYCSCLHCQAP